MDELWVEPSHRYKGIAKKLMHKADELVDITGAVGIRLYVSQDNLSGSTFFMEKCQVLINCMICCYWQFPLIPSPIFLDEPDYEDFKDKIIELYNARNKFVHGDFGIPHPSRNEVLDQNYDSYVKEILNFEEFGFEVIIATF